MLDVVSEDCGLKQPFITVNDAGDGQFIAFVELSSVNDQLMVGYIAEGEPKRKRSEAINSAVLQALRLVVATHGVTIVDPSFMVIRDMQQSMWGIVNELVELNDSSSELYRVGKKAAHRVKDIFSMFHEDCEYDCYRVAVSKVKGLIDELDNFCERAYEIAMQTGDCLNEGQDTWCSDEVAC